MECSDTLIVTKVRIIVEGNKHHLMFNIQQNKTFSNVWD